MVSRKKMTQAAREIQKLTKSEVLQCKNKKSPSSSDRFGFVEIVAFYFTP
jgi:hypothetical protein